MSVADLQDLRHSLPAGPTQQSALDRVVEQLTTATNSRGLYERLVGWGWVTPAGTALPWTHWLRRTAWNG